MCSNAALPFYPIKFHFLACLLIHIQTVSEEQLFLSSVLITNEDFFPPEEQFHLSNTLWCHNMASGHWDIDLKMVEDSLGMIRLNCK